MSSCAVAHSDAEVAQARSALAAAGAVDIQKREEEWRQSGYTAFDASAKPLPRADVAAARGKAIPVVQEELAVGKREENLGAVRVYSRVVERPDSESIELREQHASIDRRAVDRPATAADIAAFTNDSIEIRETAERPVVAKTARVVEVPAAIPARRGSGSRRRHGTVGKQPPASANQGPGRTPVGWRRGRAKAVVGHYVPQSASCVARYNTRRMIMDQQFQETKPLAPPSKFAESDLAKAASTYALGSNVSDGSIDRDAPLIANLDTQLADPSSPSGSDGDNSAPGVTSNFRAAMDHGRQVCDAYVHDYPWNAVVLAGAVGLFVGLLLSESSARSVRSR